jgi:hypothetical protein
MISVERRDKTVRILIASDLPFDADTPNVLLAFSDQSATFWDAELKRRYIRDILRAAVERHTQLAYEQGWKDAKSKKERKATTWATTLYQKGPVAW